MAKSNTKSYRAYLLANPLGTFDLLDIVCSIYKRVCQRFVVLFAVDLCPVQM